MKTEFKVESAVLHQPVNCKFLSSDKTLSKIKMPGIQMTYTPQGLLIEHKGHVAIIPSANVALMVLVAEEPIKEPKAKK